MLLHQLVQDDFPALPCRALILAYLLMNLPILLPVQTLAPESAFLDLETTCGFVLNQL